MSITELKSNSLVNLFSGTGTGIDPSAYNAFSADYTYLDFSDMEGLYVGGSWLHRAAVDLKTEHAMLLPWHLLNPKDLEVISTYKLLEKVADCDRWSWLYGGSLLTYLDDHFSVIEAPRAVPDTVHNPAYYSLRDFLDYGISNSKDIPCENCYVQYGLHLPSRLRHLNRGYGESIYAKVHKPIETYEAAIASMKQALMRHSVLAYGIDGLAELILSGQKAGVKEIITESVNSVSTHQALVYDSQVAQASFISQNLAHIEELIRLTFDNVAGALGVQSSILWGSAKSGTGGLSNGAEGEIHGFKLDMRNYAINRIFPLLSWSVLQVRPESTISKDLIDLIGTLSEQENETKEEPKPEAEQQKQSKGTKKRDTRARGFKSR